jgi:hypothetical protein
MNKKIQFAVSLSWWTNFNHRSFRSIYEDVIEATYFSERILWVWFYVLVNFVYIISIFYFFYLFLGMAWLLSLSIFLFYLLFTQFFMKKRIKVVVFLSWWKITISIPIDLWGTHHRSNIFFWEDTLGFMFLLILFIKFQYFIYFYFFLNFFSQCMVMTLLNLSIW